MDSTPLPTANSTAPIPTTETAPSAALDSLSDRGQAAAPVGAVPELFPQHFHDDDDHRPRALIIRLGPVEYAIPVEQVCGVVRHESLTRVPGTPESVRGIVNVRGAVVTVLELSVLLGAGRAVTTPSIVLLEHGTRLVGITVDVVCDVRIFEPSDGVSTSVVNSSGVTPLDAVALCAPHLLSSEEMGS